MFYKGKIFSITCILLLTLSLGTAAVFAASAKIGDFRTQAQAILGTEKEFVTLFDVMTFLHEEPEKAEEWLYNSSFLEEEEKPGIPGRPVPKPEESRKEEDKKETKEEPEKSLEDLPEESKKENNQSSEYEVGNYSDEQLLEQAREYANTIEDNYQEMEELLQYEEVGRDKYIPVLMYHHFVEGTYPPGDGAIVTIDEFEKQLAFLKQQGYTPVFADELFDMIMDKSSDSFGGKYICITVDDGYRSNFELMYPLIQKYNSKASISVIPSRIHTSYVKTKEIPKLSWEDLNEMQASGLIRIFNHSMNHVPETTVTGSEFEKAVLDGEALLDEKLKERFGRVFTYPNGVYDYLTTSKVRRWGYDLQLSTDFGVVTKNSSINMIPRITVDSGMSPQDLMEKINAAAKKSIYMN